jgi:prohibitin 1
MQKLPKIGLPIILLVVVLLIFISKSSINIGYGEAGVLFKTFGGGVVIDEPPLGEGFHIIAPWNKVYIYNVKQQEVFESKMQVLSSNGLEISYTRLREKII